MRNPCKHEHTERVSFGSIYENPIIWCQDCGAVQLNFSRWSSPKLAKEGHSDKCVDYEDYM